MIQTRSQISYRLIAVVDEAFIVSSSLRLLHRRSLHKQLDACAMVKSLSDGLRR